MNISKNLKYFFILPVVAIILSLAALLAWGLKPGIDLAGGSLLQVSYSGERPTVDTVRATVSTLGFGEVRVHQLAKMGSCSASEILQMTRKYP